jgi:hypothetical protein
VKLNGKSGIVPLKELGGTGDDRPGHARDLVGQGDGKLVDVNTLTELI